MYYIDSFEVAIYGGLVKLVVVNNSKEYKQFLQDSNIEVDDYEDFSALTIDHAKVGEGLDVWFIVLKSDNLTRFNFKDCDIDILEDLVHELVHLKNLIYSSRGIRPDLDNDEPEAYLLAYLHFQVRKMINLYWEKNVKDLE